MPDILNDNAERAKIVSVDGLSKNLLVSASAGSGKTSMLVERMVALVEYGKVDISKMAALTFTKKAANEFYQRFYDKLKLRSKPDFCKAKDDPFSQLPEPSTISGAKEKDEKALKQIDSCFFGTIDAFYQKILSEHPLEANIPSNFTLIEDDELLKIVVSKFNEYLYSDNKELKEGATYFANNVGIDRFPSLIDDVMKNYDKKLYQIPTPINLLEGQYAKYIEDFKAIADILVKNAAALKPEKPTQGSAKSWDELYKSKTRIMSLKPEDIRTGNKIFKALKDLRLDPLQVKNYLDKTNFEMFFDKVEDKKGNVKHYQFNEVIKTSLERINYYKVINFLSLSANDIHDYLIKNGALTFNLATEQLLKLLQNKDNEEVIKQIRSKYQCLLIDECQDTDIKQYEIFMRLTGNNIPDNLLDIEIDGGKLYACGDRKQGIYHFRGADVTTFDFIKDEVFNANRNKDSFGLIDLTDNHRSKPKLIKYFNETFSRLLENQDYHPIKNKGDTFDNDYGVFTYQSNKETDGEKVADIVVYMMDKYGYNFKDFMVITSSKKKESTFAKSFSLRGIPFYTEGYIDLKTSELVSVVINIFEYLASECLDKLTYAKILSSKLFNFDFTKTVDLNENYFDKLLISFNKNERLPSKILEEIIKKNVFVKTLGLNGLEIVYGFIHLLKEKENGGQIVCLDDAIKYFKDLQNDEVQIERMTLLGNSVDAVQIANAHKTKGLEKKVVILTKKWPSTTGPSRAKVGDYFYMLNENVQLKGGKGQVTLFKLPSDPAIDEVIEKEKEYQVGEENRLLYVAATRARECLIINDPLKKDGSKESDSNNGWAPLIQGLPAESLLKVEEGITPNSKEASIPSFSDQFINEFNRNGSTFKIVSPSKADSPTIHDEDFDSSNRNDDALIIGTMVHKLMENIIKCKDVILDDSLCENIVNEYGMSSYKDKLVSIKNTIYGGGFEQSSGIDNDILKLAKSANALTEVPFSYKDGNKIVNGYIDLILEFADKIVIVDYKTDVNEKDHDNQLKCYENAVVNSGMDVGKKIKTYIYNIKKWGNLWKKRRK